MVRLEWELDRAERVATAHLAHRVRMAARSGPETVSARELKKVHELGSKLFFKAGIGPGYYSGNKEPHVGQAFQPDFPDLSGWKA